MACNNTFNVSLNIPSMRSYSCLRLPRKLVWLILTDESYKSANRSEILANGTKNDISNCLFEWRSFFFTP